MVYDLLVAIRERVQEPARYRDNGAELRRPGLAGS